MDAYEKGFTAAQKVSAGFRRGSAPKPTFFHAATEWDEGWDDGLREQGFTDDDLDCINNPVDHSEEDENFDEESEYDTDALGRCYSDADDGL